MRCNQVSIFIERFGEYVPEGYPNNVQRISVYCDDSTSIFAALAKANAMVVNEINEHEAIGARSYVSTNEYPRADYKGMNVSIPIEKNRYEDDIELQFTYNASSLRKDRIWVHENLDEIIKTICSSENKKDIVIKLKEQFGLRDIQIKKLLGMRLDMFSKSDYQRDVEEQEEYESKKENSRGWNPRYFERKIRECKKLIDEYRAYIMIADNYKEMIELLSVSKDFNSFVEVMQEKYGFSRTQSGLIKLMTVDDIVSKDKYYDEIKRLEKDIEYYNCRLMEHFSSGKED